MKLFGLFLLLGLPSLAYGNSLTLYFYPSPKGIDWSTPRALTASTFANQAAGESHSIGHVNIELFCDQGKIHELTGTTGAETSEVTRLLFREQVGLGLFFHTFADGRLYRPGEITAELPERYATGNLTFLEYLVSEPTCLRLKRYLDEYRARGLDRFYGLSNRPRAGEGAGCSAFGASALEIAGLLDPVYRRHWSIALRVPRRAVGGHLTGLRVPVRRVLLAPVGRRWAAEGEAGFPLFFWSPDRMHGWVQRAWDSEKELPPLPYRRGRRGNALGFTFDARLIPTPTEPIWEG